MNDKATGKPAGAKPIKNDKTVLTRKVVAADPAELSDDDLGSLSGGTAYRPSGRYVP
jgi:hypothetical protein